MTGQISAFATPVMLCQLLFFLLTTVNGAPNSDNKMLLLHEKMNNEELLHYFDVPEAHMVNADSYEVVKMAKRSNNMAMDKRSGYNDNNNHDAVVELTAFGKAYSLKLKKNDDLLFEGAEILIATDEGTKRLEHDPDRVCHYQIDDGLHYGGLSGCKDRFQGFFRDNNTILDVLPVRPTLHQHLPSQDYHIIKKVTRYSEKYSRGKEDETDDFEENDDYILPPKIDKTMRPLPTMSKRATGSGPLTIETAVFFDCKAYESFMRFYNDQQEVINLILIMMNGIQVIF